MAHIIKTDKIHFSSECVSDEESQSCELDRLDKLKALIDGFISLDPVTKKVFVSIAAIAAILGPVTLAAATLAKREAKEAARGK